MELKKANLAEGKGKFLFMENNRSISQNKALRESILKKRSVAASYSHQGGRC